MSNMINTMLDFSLDTFKDKNDISESLLKAKKIESKSDQMQEQISAYLAECTKHELSFESSKEAAAMMRITNELESIGDSFLNLSFQIEKIENNLEFNSQMNEEIIGLTH